MTTYMTIGEFSRLTHLSVKALRHYHDVGLLEPLVDPVNSYRRYETGQVPTAHPIRRLRELDHVLGVRIPYLHAGVVVRTSVPWQPQQDSRTDAATAGER